MVSLFLSFWMATWSNFMFISYGLMVMVIALLQVFKLVFFFCYGYCCWFLKLQVWCSGKIAGSWVQVNPKHIFYTRKYMDPTGNIRIRPENVTFTQKWTRNTCIRLDTLKNRKNWVLTGIIKRDLNRTGPDKIRPITDPDF